jgi:hypothetical protein
MISKNILNYLKVRGHQLTKDDEQLVEDMVQSLTRISYSEGCEDAVNEHNNRDDSNGCDCYQPSCPRCN